MARMIRKQIVIDADRDALVSRIAEQRGTSQSEVIRMAIDALMEDIRSSNERERAHSELMEMFRNAPDLGVTDEHGRRTWTRAELYEHRGTR